MTTGNQRQPRRTLIVGLGETGLSVARFLKARGEMFAVADTRQTPPALDALRALDANVPLRLGAFDVALFTRVDRLVVSPGVGVEHAVIRRARAAGVEILGDIELFAQAATAAVAAITGSNGKSTVAVLLAEMARQAGRKVRAGGNLGPPALDLLDTPEEPELYVLELSSFQLEITESLKPAAAVVLNVSADHLDRYASLDAYAQAKARIYRDAARTIINRDDPRVAAMAPQGAPSFGLDEPARDQDYGLRELDGAAWLARGERALLPASQLRIPGRHNIANALAALALGDALGLAEDAMLTALRAFTGLPHRCQWVAERAGVVWYNDSKATNVGATLAALGGLPRTAVLIAGGDGKGADFAPLRAACAEHARAVVLIGRDAGRIGQALAGAALVVYALDMRGAVRAAAELARVGDCVLLSPACASFDMYANYAARGEAFVRAVEALQA